jgi:hypothetical protein
MRNKAKHRQDGAFGGTVPGEPVVRNEANLEIRPRSGERGCKTNPISRRMAYPSIPLFHHSTIPLSSNCAKRSQFPTRAGWEASGGPGPWAIGTNEANSGEARLVSGNLTMQNEPNLGRPGWPSRGQLCKTNPICRVRQRREGVARNEQSQSGKGFEVPSFKRQAGGIERRAGGVRRRAGGPVRTKPIRPSAWPVVPNEANSGELGRDAGGPDRAKQSQFGNGPDEG